ncbi:MAG: hypothetical protein RLZZ584_3422, partial [Pseudomonadota bacterium]
SHAMRALVPRHRPAQHGATLIELMVGVIIGMLAVLVIAQVALVYEGQKRSTTSGSDAQVNGALALQTVQRDVQMGGYGPTSGLSSVGGIAMPGAGCVINARLGSTPAAEAPQRLVPILIGDGAGGTPDTLRIMAAGQRNFSVPIAVMSDVGHVSTDQGFRLRSGINVGNAQGDLMLAVHVPTTGAPQCTLFNLNMNGLNKLVRTGSDNAPIETEGAALGTVATGTPLFDTNAAAGGIAVGPRLGHVADGSADAIWNGDGATPLFPDALLAPVDPSQPNTYLVNLGRPADFIYRSYSVGTAGLAVRIFDATTGNATTEDLYSGILSLQAVYGKALGADTQQVTVWNATDPALDVATATGTAINGWSRVVAVRIAVVARSQQYEKTEVTTTLPVWHPDGVTAESIKVDTNTDWKHYRYKVYETVVPLRNMIWQS